MVKIEDLKHIYMLEGIPDHLLRIISAEAQLSILGADSRLFSAGDEIDIFYMLIMGQVALKVALTPDIDLILDNLQSGSSFGSSALFKGGKASYTAICQEPCEVITLYGPRMQDLFGQNRELAFYMMSGVAKQYKIIMDLRSSMIMNTLDQNPEFKQNILDIEKLTPAY